MSASSRYSYTALITATSTATISPSGSPSMTTTISTTGSPITASPSLSPSFSQVFPVSPASSLPTAPPTPTALWSPVLAPPTITAQPSQAAGPAAAPSRGITVGDLTAACIVLGAMLFISIIHMIHYNNKYKKEKQKRALLEVRGNPVHSQVRSVLPNY
jgi:hypothetical protein